MRKLLALCVVGVMALQLTVKAQENVGIGTTTPNASALLDLTATNKGLLIPRVTLVGETNGTTPVNTPATGLLVYNNGGTLAAGFWYWDGTKWVQVGAGGSTSCTTLDEAYDCGGAGAGRSITADAGSVEITQPSTGTATSPITGINLRTSGGYGVWGQALQGVVGQNITTATGFGVAGTTTNGVGTSGLSSDPAHYGVQGVNQATSNATGECTGVLGSSTNGIGVVGQTSTGDYYGVYGHNENTADGAGLYANGFYGVYSETTNSTNGWSFYGTNYLGLFEGGGALISGDLGVTGTKNFIIEHPSQPGKLIKHYCVEGPKAYNMYRGNVELDANGEAIVTLPEYFEEINTNFSYHLTPIGAYANLYIKEKIENGKFVVAGGNAGMEVSWTVYADRNDEYVRTHEMARKDVINITDDPHLEQMFDKSKRTNMKLKVGYQKPLELIDPTNNTQINK